MQSRIQVDVDFGTRNKDGVLRLEKDVRDAELWRDAINISDDRNMYEENNARHVLITLPQHELTEEQHQWLNRGKWGIVHYDVTLVPHTFTLREYLSSMPQHGWKAYYKDCRIEQVAPISERYALVELQVPQPYGGMIEEIVSVETVIEYREEE